MSGPDIVKADIVKGRNALIDDQMTSQVYEAPRVVDYGDLQELTAGCLGGVNGDAFTRANGGYGGPTFHGGTASSPINCSSTP
jgi:hypothetical protein